MSNLERATVRVAIAQRKYDVADALHKEFRRKTSQAEEEANTARRELEYAEMYLSKAATEAHEEVHGKPISSEDRQAFETRWAARFESIKAKREYVASQE